MPDSTEGASGKPRKRLAAKPPSEQKARKVKSTIHLSREADQRLNIHCAMMDFDRSALVEKLITDHLRRYVVSDRGGQENTASGDAAAEQGRAGQGALPPLSDQRERSEKPRDTFLL